jgi:hypothetical protein
MRGTAGQSYLVRADPLTHAMGSAALGSLGWMVPRHPVPQFGCQSTNSCHSAAQTARTHDRNRTRSEALSHPCAGKSFTHILYTSNFQKRACRRSAKSRMCFGIPSVMRL